MIAPHSKQRRFIVPLLLLCFSIPAIAFRTGAGPFRAVSDNGTFIASILPRESSKPPAVEVFKWHNGNSVLQWRTSLSNALCPCYAWISDDGQYVVTVDEYPRLGYGENVVAIYAKTGLIKRYSLETIAGEIPNTGENGLLPHTGDSRHWQIYCIRALQGTGPEARFAIWPAWSPRWYVFNLADGSMERLSDEALKKWNDFGTRWSLEMLGNSKEALRHRGILDYHQRVTACRFLGYTKNLANHKLLEQLLDSEELDIQEDPGLRKAADWSLAMLDGVDTKLINEKDGRFYRLGTVKAEIQFPRKPSNGEGYLHYYVFPERVKQNAWRHATPVFRGEYCPQRVPDRTINVTIPAMKPGRYWLKVVWNLGKPPEPGSETPIEAIRRAKAEDARSLGPAPGDFESPETPLFEILPAKAIEISTACDRLAR